LIINTWQAYRPTRGDRRRDCRSDRRRDDRRDDRHVYTLCKHV